MRGAQLSVLPVCSVLQCALIRKESVTVNQGCDVWVCLGDRQLQNKKAISISKTAQR